MKPFIETLRVTNPVRQSRASSRKRVLRGDGRPSLRSVDSEIKRCVIEPRNFLVVSPRLCQSRGPSLALATPGPTGVPGHTGVGGTWRMINGFRGNLGDPAVSIRKCRPENRAKNSRLIHSYVLSCWGRTRDTTYGIAKRRKRSAAKWAARSRSVSQYRRARGTTRGTLGREGGAIL